MSTSPSFGKEIEMLKVITPFEALDHDHHACLEQAIALGEETCARLGLRFTAIRREVLEIVWAHHRPARAYDIIEALSKRTGKQVAPPTVYRALDFLLEAGLIHRLASENAFLGCAAPQRPHIAQFLICRQCGSVAELSDPALAEFIAGHAAAMGFSAEGQIVEVSGTCEMCRELG